MQINQFLRRVSFALPIALVALLIASPTGALTTYPPPQVVTPNYVEATTPLSFSGGGIPGDDQSSQITLPFPFDFYGTSYTQAFVSTNGYINFLAPSSFFTNSCPIQRDSLRGAIYAFWDDLYVDGSASVRTRLLDTAPNRRFVIEWRNVTFFVDRYLLDPRRVDFEIVLHETGAITLQYRNISQVAGDLYGRERGNSATIGLENERMDSGAHADGFFCSGSYTGAGDGILRSDSGTFAIRFGQVTRPVAADIKPGGCPNPFNVGSKGVLPAAILGTAELNVTDIDPTTVTLNVNGNAVAPLRSSLEDVGTPYTPFVGKTSPDQCTALGPDGNLDMTFKFNSEDVTAALGTVNDGDVRVLTLNGKLRDGTEISGEDVITILKKGK